ncbi:uncharacterized protein [Euwallacea fornicatus]|uniref:uncharacterized protein n=1 Tax=Euwallacea fornicatus TaxID=995702 RepID=UPI00338DA987
MSLLTLLFLVSHVLVLGVNSSDSGILIKAGVSKSQGEAQNENLEDVKFHKGTANYEKEDGFNKDQEQKLIEAQDFGKFGELASNKKAFEDSNNYQKENFHQNGADQAGNLASKVAHHKGHHRTGFTNSYHKDESGSNTSFFDDGSDQADQIEQKNYKQSYGDVGQHRQGGGKYDSSDFANEQAKHGLYDNAGRFEKGHGNNRNYNRNNYYDGKEALARRNLGNAYEGGHRYAEDNYVHPPPLPPYYPPLPYRPLPPPPPKHHITIYEDPRYVDSDLRYRRSDGHVDDYVELDVRRPLQRTQKVRYYDEPDYFYYD